MVKTTLGVVAAAALSVISPASAQVNVALGKPVSLFAGTVNGEPLLTIVDGLFLPRGQQWQDGTVWWEGVDPTLEIDLQGSFEIDSLVVQADDNDAYTLSYRDPATQTWSVLWDIPNYDPFGAGMQTRPNPDDNRERFFLPQPILADALRFAAASGDNLYSVSEVQAFLVPAPGTAAGLVLLMMGGRRRR